MSKFLIVLFCFSLLFCKKNDYSRENTNQDINLFFENFIAQNKGKINLNSVKKFIHGDSLAFENWIDESKVDTIQLKKHLDSKKIKKLKNIVSEINPNIFIKNTNPNHQTSDVKHNSNCGLLSINFLVFNEKKDKIIIYYSQNCYPGFVEIYNKNINNKWVLHKLVCRN